LEEEVSDDVREEYAERINITVLLEEIIEVLEMSK